MSNLADDFYCLTLDEHTGMSRLAPRVTGVGLASAILAELLIAGHVVIEGGEIMALHVQPPQDELAGNVHTLMLNRPQHRDPGVWIGFLARDAFIEIGNRLVRRGVLTAIRKRRLTGSRIVYEPLDRSSLAWPGIRIAQSLVPADQITLNDLTCVGLAVATGLINRVLWDPELHAAARASLPAALARLPPPVAELLARTETAVGEAVLTNRT